MQRGAPLSPTAPFTPLTHNPTHQPSPTPRPPIPEAQIPYEKGFALLCAIQGVVGAPAMEAFTHSYFQTFKYTSITAGDFARYAVAYFAEGRHALPRVSHSGAPPVHGGPLGAHDPADIPALATFNTGSAPVPPAGVSAEEAAAAAAGHSIDLSASIDWEAWLFSPGMPPAGGPAFDTTERAVIDAHVAAWLADPAAAAAGGPALTAAWRAPQWMAFAEAVNKAAGELAGRTPPAAIAPAVLRAMDGVYALSASRNAEVRSQWCQAALRSGLDEAVPPALAFLAEQGRMKVRAWARVGEREGGRDCARTCAPRTCAPRNMRCGSLPISTAPPRTPPPQSPNPPSRLCSTCARSSAR